MIFLLIPLGIFELYLSLKVGESIGFIFSLLWIVASMALGLKLLRVSSVFAMMKMQVDMMTKGRVNPLSDAPTAIFVGAILLIIPGVLSDVAGICLTIYGYYLRYIDTIQKKEYKGEDDVIDVEIVDTHADGSSGS